MTLHQGDIITYKDGDQVKILAVCGEAVLISVLDNFDSASVWYTEEDLINRGWTLPKPKWEPKVGETYWCITNEGKVSSHTWHDYDFQKDIQNFMGVFQTKEEALARLAEIKRLIS